MPARRKVRNRYCGSYARRRYESLEPSYGGKMNIGFFSALFLIFLALKLAHIIAWSWWWVTAPLWAPFPVVFVLVVIFTLWRETRRK